MSAVDPRVWLEGLLPKGAHKHIPEILAWGEVSDIHRAEVVGARVEVERVTVGGLEIGLDATGNAVSVYSPQPMEVTQWA